MQSSITKHRRILSPIQLALFSVVGVLVAVFAVLIVRAYIDSGQTAEDVEKASFEVTGLANIQRETLVLQSEVARALRNLDGDLEAVDIRRALLGNQVRLVSAKAADGGRLDNDVNDIKSILLEYDEAITPLRSGAPEDLPAVIARLDEVFDRLERQVKAVYEQEEQSFFSATNRTLRSGRNSQVLLLAVSGLVLVLGLILGLSLRATVSALRSEMSERDRVQKDLQDTNEELVKVQDQVVRSEKLAAIGQMSGGVAHDLRNPLGAIKNASYMVNKRLTADGIIESNPKMKHYLEIIDQQIARSNRIITDLMTFAKVNQPTLIPTKIDQVIEESLETMDQHDNIQISKHIDPGLSLVMADADQLQRVFLNLANNAQEAMPDGGQLTISTQRHNGHVEVAFTDTGGGISDENIEKIFDPLFTTKTKGTGLGLAVCNEIVTRHGGTIVASRNPEPKCGSTFAVKLPVASYEAQPEGEQGNG